MLVAWNLGFSSLLFLLFPLIFLLVRWKWRAATQREEKIRKLLAAAAEEAARAELEASVPYTTVSAPPPHTCAVCFCPTTTRCSRCKAVRYCSGKCQIIHWRQGHRDECHPPSLTTKPLGGTDSGWKVKELDQHAKPAETITAESIFGDASSDAKVPCRNDTEMESDVDKEEVNSTTESLGTSFSGFSSSSAAESSDDASVSWSISSNESERVDCFSSADITEGPLEPASRISDELPTKLLSPEFTSLAESVSSIANLNTSNQLPLGGGIGESGSRSSSSSSSDVIARQQRSVIDPLIESRGFWGRNLESTESQNDAHDDSIGSKSCEVGNGNISNLGSPLYSSFGSGRTSLSHVRGPEVERTILEKAILVASGSDQASGRVALTKASADGPNDKKSPSFKKSSDISSSSLHVPGLTANLSSSASSVHLSSRPKDISNNLYSGSVKTNTIVSGSISSSRPINSREDIHLSNSGSGTKYSYGVGEHSVVKNGDHLRRSKSLKQYTVVSQNHIVDRPSYKGFFPYDLFVKLYNSNDIELRPCGLINCGNSCYANAVLQCLVFTPPFTAYFLQGLHSKACLKKDWCFNCEFENLILRVKRGKSPLSAMEILSQLPNIGSQLGIGREEDAHEFLRYAVDKMQSICLNETGLDGAGSTEREATTLIGLTFGGYLRSQIVCMKCQGKSERHERMMDLTVEIEGDIATLEEALRQFTRTEFLDGENKYECGRCKSYERAKKKLKISEAPNILTITLKRFQTGKFGKLNKTIKFPEILDLAPFVSGTGDESTVYGLYGVIVHLDIMNAAFSGHYVCYVKGAKNRWFKLDDSIVTPTDLESVLSKEAYMLLYARRSPRPPRLLRNSVASADPKTKDVTYRKSFTALSKSASTGPSVQSSLNNRDGQASIESFYSKFNRLQRILEEDSSSDCSSFLSSNSDEGSCSTNSLQGSTSTDDLSDPNLSDLGHGWKSYDSETSSSSSSPSPSPLNSRHSPLANSDRYTTAFPGAKGFHFTSDLRKESSRSEGLIGKEGDSFWKSDNLAVYRVS